MLSPSLRGRAMMPQTCVLSTHSKGLWEIRAIYSGALAREFFGFDRERIVLLHGYVKRTGQPASTHDFNKAFDYWTDDQKTRRVSPVEQEETTQLIDMNSADRS